MAKINPKVVTFCEPNFVCPGLMTFVKRFAFLQSLVVDIAKYEGDMSHERPK